jgi:nucleotidyltransferase substrate binding protein (TIGR01987 family)
MDRARERLTIAVRALASLGEVALLPMPTAVERDAAIQRFEYSFEATWKAAQRVLLAREGVEVGSPKSAMRAAREAGFLSDTDAAAALAMADDRNLTVHTYNEALARAIYARLGGHLELASPAAAASPSAVRMAACTARSRRSVTLSMNKTSFWSV